MHEDTTTRDSKTKRTKCITSNCSGPGPPDPVDVEGGSTEEEVLTDGQDSLPGASVVHHIATRSATGSLGRKPKKNESPPAPDSPSKKEDKHSVENGEIKSRRQWELWSSEDMNVFFETVNEHGKDFDAIHAALMSKHKKKGVDVKSKNQIRHFYYRTCQKIFKVINLSEYEQKEGINRQVLELYGLINYGELRKKLGGKLDAKNTERLNELIFKGFTVAKVKGKKYVRIKTPICKALKKLNHIEDSKDENGSKVPENVSIELLPLSNKSWAHVQSLSHNPRLRISVKTNRPLTAIFDYLSKKWQPDRVRLRKKLELSDDEPIQELKLHLTASSKLVPFKLKPTNQSQKTELDFTHFLEHVKESNAELSNLPTFKRGVKAAKFKTDLSGESEVNGPDADTETDPSDSECTELLRKIQRLSSGMLRKDVDDIKVGELFFLLGSPSKVSLEYEWVDLHPSITADLIDFHAELSNTLRRLVHLANPEFSDIKKPKTPSSSSQPVICTCGAKTNTPPSRKGVRNNFVNGPSAGVSSRNSGVHKPIVSIAPKPSSPDADGVFRVPTSVPKRAKLVTDSTETTDNIVARHPESFIPMKQRRLPKKRQEVIQHTLLPKVQVPQRQIMTLAMLGPNALAPSANVMRVVASPAFSIQQPASTVSSSDDPPAPRKPSGPRRITLTPVPENSEPGTFPPASVIRCSQAPIATKTPSTTQSDNPSLPARGEMEPFFGVDRPQPEATAAQSEPNPSGSPPSIPSFFDISLPSVADATEENGPEKFLDISLDSSNGLSALLDCNSQSAKSALSPNKVIRRLTAEDQWIPTEEFSLGHLLDESPQKKLRPSTSDGASASVHLNECSRDSLIIGKLDVDSTLQCMMNENSMEYATKFDDLVAQIAAQSENSRLASSSSENH